MAEIDEREIESEGSIWTRTHQVKDDDIWLVVIATWILAVFGFLTLSTIALPLAGMLALAPTWVAGRWLIAQIGNPRRSWALAPLAVMHLAICVHLFVAGVGERLW